MLLWLALMALPAGGALSIDSGIDYMRVENPSVSPISVGFKATDLVVVEARIEGLQSTAVWRQCPQHTQGTPPRVSLFGPSDSTSELSHGTMTKGEAVLYIGDDLDHRSDVERLLRKAGQNLRPVPVDGRAYPDVFALLQAAPIVLLNGQQWARLNDDQRAATKMAVAGGLNLVLAAPFPPEAVESLKPYFGHLFEDNTSAEMFDLGNGRIELGHYAFKPRRFDGVLWRAKGRVVSAHQAVGLGQVRLVGFSFSNLVGTQLAHALLDPERAGMRMAKDWLMNNHSMETKRRSPLGGWPLAAIVAFVAIGIYGQARLLRLAVGVGVWSLFVLFFPAADHVLDGDTATTFIVPVDGQSDIALTRLSSVSVRGGDAAIEHVGPPSSLLSARGAYVCLLGIGETRTWLVSANASARQTLMLVHSLPAGDYGEDRVETIDDQTGTAFEGATIRRVRKGIELPIAMGFTDHRVVAL